MRLSLLTPVQVGDLELKNRVIMAPLTRSRAENPDYAPTDLVAEYYRQRAGAGLIISEATVVSPQGRGYIHTPGIHSAAQLAAWKKVTSAVHEASGKIFCQLWHVGAISHPWFHDGNPPVAPSAVNPNSKVFIPSGFRETVTPRPLETAEVASVVEDFGAAAANAKLAGFDGVEIHASNGYLFHQFFNNATNLRTDHYGGSLENKTRFLFEVIEAVRRSWSVGRIGVRINPMMHGIYGLEIDADTRTTFDHIAQKLSDLEIGYLHVSRAKADPENPDHIQDVVGHFREVFQGHLMVNGGYDRDSGEAEIATGRADSIAYGRLFIANPDLPYRFEHDLETAEPDSQYFYQGGAKGYTDYPFAEGNPSS